jgi:hypothetical protein
VGFFAILALLVSARLRAPPRSVQPKPRRGESKANIRDLPSQISAAWSGIDAISSAANVYCRID